MLMKNVIIRLMFRDDTYTDVVETNAETSFEDAVAAGIKNVLEQAGEDIDSPYDCVFTLTSVDV